MRGFISTVAVVAFLALPSRVTATTVTIDFEGLGDLDPVINQYSGQGVTFENAMALVSGNELVPFSGTNGCGTPIGSLIDSSTPAHSGCNVILDEGGPIRVVFAAPVSLFSAFFTYSTQLQFEAFDGASASLGTATSLFSENLGDGSGNPTNELVSLAFAGIRSVVITGGANSESFTLDDLTFTTADTEPPVNTPVPEPGTIVLVGLAGTRLLVKRRTRR
jgi:hypothetical protein